MTTSSPFQRPSDGAEVVTCMVGVEEEEVVEWKYQYGPLSWFQLVVAPH